MMSKKERHEDIKNTLRDTLRHSDGYARKLYADWCKESGNGNTPYTPLSDWGTFCDTHTVSPKNIEEFRSYDTYFHIYNGNVITIEYISEEFEYGDNFNECIQYYAETIDRYNRAMAILKGDKYIINNNYDIYI